MTITFICPLYIKFRIRNSDRHIYFITYTFTFKLESSLPQKISKEPKSDACYTRHSVFFSLESPGMVRRPTARAQTVTNTHRRGHALPTPPPKLIRRVDAPREHCSDHFLTAGFANVAQVMPSERESLCALRTCAHMPLLPLHIPSHPPSSSCRHTLLLHFHHAHDTSQFSSNCKPKTERTTEKLNDDTYGEYDMVDCNHRHQNNDNLSWPHVTRLKNRSSKSNFKESAWSLNFSPT